MKMTLTLNTDKSVTFLIDGRRLSEYSEDERDNIRKRLASYLRTKRCEYDTLCKVALYLTMTEGEAIGDCCKVLEL